MKYRNDSKPRRQVRRVGHSLHRLLAAAGACLALMAASLGAGADAWPYRTSSPEATIETLHDGLVEAAARAGAADLGTRYEILRPLIAATHDLAYIAEFTIRRQWADLTSEQRAAFIAAFERLSVMTYATRFAGLSEDTLRISDAPAESAAGRSRVSASIARPRDTDIPLEYMLHQSEHGWRIINIVADGVSDLALKRAEYQRVLAGGSIGDLVSYLEEQTARMAAGEERY